MSLHPISEPAGTLMTGWKLVPKRDPHAADIHGEPDDGELVPSEPAAEAARTLNPASRWEDSERQLGEVG